MADAEKPSRSRTRSQGIQVPHRKHHPVRISTAGFATLSPNASPATPRMSKSIDIRERLFSQTARAPTAEPALKPIEAAVIINEDLSYLEEHISTTTSPHRTSIANGRIEIRALSKYLENRQVL